MSITTPTPTLGTLSGTPVMFYPVTTPWPSQPGCDQYIYRQASSGSFLAWDPVYAKDLVDKASSCFSPQMSSWWFQDHSAATLTSLGPTSVCPAAFSPVLTVAWSTPIGTTAEETVQSIYCCPSNYRLGSILTGVFGFAPDQCTSTVSIGETMTYIRYTSSLTPQNTTRRFEAGSGIYITVETTRSSLPPTSTVALSTNLFVYAEPVNGINIVRGPAASTTTRTTAPGQPGRSGSSGTPPGIIAAAAIASVLGFLLLAAMVVGYFVR
ncbi:hypothetical protein GE09DRAFT_1293735 [Coniochaeta sp. 2T2.1]|nr:hypothetical protein GE09DRAFT_1293735 [Coniochaeta sp. 2T2.1]